MNLSYSGLAIGFSTEKYQNIDKSLNHSKVPVKLLALSKTQFEKSKDDVILGVDLLLINREIITPSLLEKVKDIKTQHPHLEFIVVKEDSSSTFELSVFPFDFLKVIEYGDMDEPAIDSFSNLILSCLQDKTNSLLNLIEIFTKDIKTVEEYYALVQQFLDKYIQYHYFQILKVSSRRGEQTVQIFAQSKKISKKEKVIIENQNYEFLKNRDPSTMNLYLNEVGDYLVVTFNLGFYEKYPVYAEILTDKKEKNLLLSLLNLHFFKISTKALAYIEALEFKEIFSDLAHKDDVTGLYNQRRLYKDLEMLIKSGDSKDKFFSVLFIDIDNFKLVNDGHGHLVGTELLNSLSHVFREYIRDTDLIYRYGGDEFVIILPETSAESSKVVCERLIKVIKQRNFKISNGSIYQLSVSIGIAEFPKDAKTSKDILSMADSMMYNSKKMGRGRVMSAKDII